MKIDPRDADSYYFEGVCYQELKQFDKAIAILRRRSTINPLHASAEFATGARAAALRPYGGGQGALQAIPASDQHQDSARPSDCPMASRATTRPLRRLRSRRREASAMIPVKLVAQSVDLWSRPNLRHVRSGPPPAALA